MVWGIFGSAGFYALIFDGPLNLPLVKRYFTGHPVEYMETVLFSIGLAALILKALDFVSQRSRLASTSPWVPDRKPPNRLKLAMTLLQRLDQLPQGRREEYFIRRLRAALEHVRSHGSAETLNDELKYLSDIDASRLHAGFGLFRVILWAIPILGFLGTVVGITMALNSVDLQIARPIDAASAQRLGPEVRHHGRGPVDVDGIDVRSLFRRSGGKYIVGAGRSPRGRRIGRSHCSMFQPVLTAN